MLYRQKRDSILFNRIFYEYYAKNSVENMFRAYKVIFNRIEAIFLKQRILYRYDDEF